MHLRNKFHFSLYLLIAVMLLSTCKHEKNMEAVKKEVAQILQREKGVFAVAFKDLQTGETLLLNERETFHAASTMKTPVMIEVYKQASKGKFALSDSVVVKNEFYSIVDSSVFHLNPADDSEQELYKQVGKKKVRSSLVYDMIIVSSNLATNMVIEWVGPKNVTQSMRELGAKDIQVLRGVEDQKAFDQGLVNTTTAFDMMLIFEKLARGEVVDSAACKSMIDILLDQKFTEIIPAQLPKDVRVAHKTGNIKGVNHDVAIVFLPDGRRYVLVLMSKETVDEEAAKQAMAVVSKKIYDYVIGNTQ
jgi:beta-lactamase class A